MNIVTEDAVTKPWLFKTFLSSRLNESLFPIQGLIVLTRQGGLKERGEDSRGNGNFCLIHQKKYNFITLM